MSQAHHPLAASLTRDRSPLSLAGVTPLAGVAAVLVAIPALGADDGPVMCLSRKHTDIACPSCGMTRGVAALARGDMAGSWAMHPLAIVFVLQALIAGVALALDVGTVRSTWFRWIPAVLTLDVVALLAVWVVRFSAGTLPLA